MLKRHESTLIIVVDLLIKYWIASAAMPVNSLHKIQVCKVLCHAAKSMQKSDSGNFEELSSLLFSGVQLNLNQVDNTVRSWSLLVFELLVEKFGQKERITISMV